MSSVSGYSNSTFNSTDLGAAAQLQVAMLSHGKFDAAAADLATRLAILFEVERVSIGLLTGRHIRVIAVSHGTTVDFRQDIFQPITAAMHEAVDQAATIVYPNDGGQPRVVMAHAILASQHGGSAISVPLAGNGILTGAITFERHGAPHLDGHDVARCEELLRILAPVLLLKRDNDRPLAIHATAALAELGHRIRRAKLSRKLAAVAGAALLATAFLLPLPYKVTAPVRLEGAVQRALTAPDDGYLQQVAVRPGDSVKAGQVLAELAQQDLHLEHTKVAGELAQYESGYGAALAQADRSMLVSYNAKASQARARLDLIARQIERAVIRAPFDGVVISGDLSQSLGAPVQRGNPLMVVAPLEHYRLIAEVDERDIAQVQTGASGRITLAALPDKEIRFITERIAPVAVTRDGRHFFEVEGRLASSSSTVRPGLEGVARIDAPGRPLASALGYRLWIWLRLSLWSLGWWS